MMIRETSLFHHGIKGQRWGVRRFQNEDGSLTAKGRKRYDVNEDGSTQMKSKYRRGQNIKGVIKGVIGARMITTGINRIGAARSADGGLSSKSGRKTLNKAVFGMLIGAAVATSAAKNFVNANKNRSFNTTGMGGTPENFSGKAKTRQQVLAQQARNKK